ncbi:hypothetical protein [Kribbella sp. NPDC051770]|uniref:hypothetical protein n=1 Tax=Kribbella sp. NPDC051770 TaxID=3155413 RepID=UPI0034152F7C
MSIDTSEWVALSTRFTPGWPWPEESYGLDPMFGADGWCRGCGTPKGPQSGALVMQGRKFPTAGVWMPNWLFDVVCLSGEVAEQVADRFAVELREVRKPLGPTSARQLIPTVTRQPWYDPAGLSTAVKARHAKHNPNESGSQCSECSTWKWLPIGEAEASVQLRSITSATDVVASPEVFGDGLKAFRHLLFRRSLGEFLAGTHPRAWRVVEVAPAV